MVRTGICSPWLSTFCQGNLEHVLRGWTPPPPSSPLNVSGSSTYRVVETEVERRISLASSTGRLDLSECGLLEVPPRVFQLEELVDLSLAGNNIGYLPDDIQNLSNLRRLGLAGNALRVLPKGIGRLKHLEGLWLHGNKLHCLPDEIGDLGQLRTLALAGNKLRCLPGTISNLTNVQILSVAGNLLQEFPGEVGRMQKLRVLAAYGNKLSKIPEWLTQLPSLEDLWLQGNYIEDMPTDLRWLKLLKQLSLADNLLSALPESICQLQALETLWIYGNRLQRIPQCIADLPKLAHVWLEGNPLEIQSLREALPAFKQMKVVGVSCDVGSELLTGDVISVSKVGGSGVAASQGGYFKLQIEGDSKLVIVAFGSAPAVPNWGGLLKRVRKSLNMSGVAPAFDILYVVDSCRSWYTHAGYDRDVHIISPQDSLECSDPAMDPARLSRPGGYYRSELEIAVMNYSRVLMLGDSMGASAALLFSDLATSVMAFCPQVDLTTSSIRPGVDEAWLQGYKDEILNSVSSSPARITVHCGSWSHDLQQAKLLPSNKVELVEHALNDHRLAKELDSSGELLGIVQRRIQEEMIQCESSAPSRRVIDHTT